MNWKHHLRFWVPVYIYLILIFIISSISFPALTIGVGEGRRISINSWLHVGEYALLGFLFYRAFVNSDKILLKKYSFMLAIIFATAYGVTDEIHQLFVPGRVCDIKDVFCDGVGSCFVFLRKIFK